MFHHRTSIRRWAAPIALLWVLWLAAGVAGACGIEISHAPAGDVAVIAQPGQHAPNSDSDAACIEFCEQAGMSAPTSGAPADKAASGRCRPAASSDR